MPFVPDAPQQPRFVPDAPPPTKPNPVTGTAVPGRQPPLADIGGGGVMGALAAIPQNVAAEAAGGLSGIAGAVLPGPAGQGAKWSEKVSGALSAPAGNKAQQTAAKVLGLPGELWGKVSNWVGERGSSVPAIGAFGKGAAEVLPSLVGARAGVKPRAPLTPEQSRVAAARDAGYKMTPAEMGAGPVAQTAASLAGEPRLAKKLTAENQAPMVEKVKADLGIPKTDELNLDSLSAARKDAHKAYQDIRQVGDVATDSTYVAEADAIGAEYRSAAQSFPKIAKKDVESLVEGLKVAKFNASEAIDQIRILRTEADEFFRKGDARLAKANRAAADMIEAQIGRHLEATGQADVLAQFKAARERIAKTYAAQKALVGDDAINPQGLAKQIGQGKPITGALREVGEFARDFERSSQKPTHQATGPTIHDAALGTLQTIARGGSLLPEVLSLGARPALRSAIASRPAQALMDPRTNLHTLEALGIASVPRPQEESR